jgi:hypothetical protein
MREGAFALIDCLGFKGIWRRTDPQLLLKKLLEVEEAVRQQVAEREELKFFKFSPVVARIRLLSDTVAISLQYKHKEDLIPSESDKNWLVMIMCLLVVKILDIFITDEPPLVLRGCISYGEHISEGNFIVGQAVDDVAEHMNIAEGAFVWLLPKAATRYESHRERMNELLASISPEAVKPAIEYLGVRNYHPPSVNEWGSEAHREEIVARIRYSQSLPIVISDYEMPLKSGARLRCAVLNPLSFYTSSEKRKEIIEQYSKVISGNQIDIWLKHQHTMDLLEVADQICSSFRDTHVEPETN